MHVSLNNLILLTDIPEKQLSVDWIFIGEDYLNGPASDIQGKNHISYICNYETMYFYLANEIN